VDNTFFQ
jgi:hypothetical protein